LSKIDKLSNTLRFSSFSISLNQIQSSKKLKANEKFSGQKIDKNVGLSFFFLKFFVDFLVLSFERLMIEIV